MIPIKYLAGISFVFFTLSVSGCGNSSTPSAPAPPLQGTGAPMVDSSKQEARYLEVVAQDARNVNAWIGLGNMYMDSGRFAEAVDAYGKALEITPENVNVRIDMGTCYRRLGQPERAVEEYRKGLSYEPNHANGLANTGIVLAYDLQDFKGALEVWEKYLKVAPGHRMAEQIRQDVARLKDSLASQPVVPGTPGKP